jgi:hypothetical protein
MTINFARIVPMCLEMQLTWSQSAIQKSPFISIVVSIWIRDSRKGSRCELEIKIHGASIKGPTSVGEHISLMSYKRFQKGLFAVCAVDVSTFSFHSSIPHLRFRGSSLVLPLHQDPSEKISFHPSCMNRISSLCHIQAVSHSNTHHDYPAQPLRFFLVQEANEHSSNHHQRERKWCSKSSTETRYNDASDIAVCQETSWVGK